VVRALLWRRSGDLRRATQLAARGGIAFAALFIIGGFAAIAMTRDPLYAWYAILGGFLARQGWMHERAARALPPTTLEPRDVEVGAAA
jgi:hypothetical protein